MVTVEVANEDERRILETLLRAVRDLGSSSCLTMTREDLLVKYWINGRTAGRIQLTKQLPAWREREVLRSK